MAAALGAGYKLKGKSPKQEDWLSRINPWPWSTSVLLYFLDSGGPHLTPLGEEAVS